MKSTGIDALIAASAHDAKNSLGVVLESLDELAEQLDGNGALGSRVGELRNQVGRVGTTLARILTLYRIGAERYPLDLAVQPVCDIIEEAVLAYRSALAARGLEVELDCPALLTACFDAQLVGGVIADALHNACRFARSRVRISAAAEGKGVAIRVEDDGAGVGGKAADPDADGERGFATPSTGLGTGFAALVAQLHRHGERCGSVSLDNASRYGGARWELVLP